MARGSAPPRSSRTPRHAPGEAVRLRPADPFELIRWLARSQGDPRKAVAELVQNSLDANASHIVVVAPRSRCIRVRVVARTMYEVSRPIARCLRASGAESTRCSYFGSWIQK